MEKNEKRYAKLIRQIRPVLVRRYGEDKTGKLLRDMEPIYDRFLAETPSIGGKKNPMSVNTDMALPFFALYEASGRSISAEAIHAKLIRHHTVAQGADTCDYWYIGDQET